MRISARCDYACRALLELSLHWPKEEPLQIHYISEQQKIPVRYLVQILIHLKRAGLLRSHRGKEGGYNLAKHPADIRLGEVIRHMGGPLLPVANSTAQKDSVFSGIWKDVERSMSTVLDKISFEDISKKARGLKDVLVYAI